MGLPQVLEAACLANDVEKVQILLGDFQYQQDIITDLAHLSCEKNLPEILRVVISVAADVECLLSATDAANDCLIHTACKSGALEAVKVLIESGDLPTRESPPETGTDGATSTTKVTPLHAACKGGNVALVQYLAEFDGVDLEGLCHDGTSCMHLACVSDAVNVAEYLAAKAPNLVNAKAIQGYTPLTTCATFLSFKSIRLMLQLTQPHTRVELFDLFVIALTSTLVGMGNEDARCDTLKAILKLVDVETVTAFVNQPIDDHSRKNTEECAIHLAARAGLAETLSLLISNGADVTVQNAQGQRALDICLEFKGESHMACVALLVDQWEKLRLEAERNMLLLIDEELELDKKRYDAARKEKRKQGKRKGKKKKNKERKPTVNVKVAATNPSAACPKNSSSNWAEQHRIYNESEMGGISSNNTSEQVTATSSAPEIEQPLLDESALNSEYRRVCEINAHETEEDASRENAWCIINKTEQKSQSEPKASAKLPCSSVDRKEVATYFNEAIDRLHAKALPLDLTVFNLLGEGINDLSAAQLEVLHEVLELLSKRVIRRQLDVAHNIGIEKGQAVTRRAL